MMPAEVQAMVPESFGKVIPLLLFLGTLIARFVPQPKAVAKIEEAANGPA